jgi:hypothetical protein
MADPNLGQVVTTAWENVHGNGPTDNIFSSQGLVYLLRDGYQEKVSGGRLFEYSLEYATNTTFRSVGEMETLDTTRVDVFDAARFDQKIFAGTVVFSDLETLRNAPENRKMDVVAAKIKNGTNSAMEQMNTMLYGDGTGNGGKDMDGLAKIISSTPTTGTVGGINAATWTFWRNKQTSGAKTTTLFDNLRSAMTSIHNQCSLGGTDRKPTGVVTDRTTFEGYEGLLVAIERLVKDTPTKETGGDIGFLNDAIQFKGIPLIYDENATSATVYFLNTNYLHLTVLSGAWMKMKDPVEPGNQLTRIHRVFTVGNLCTDARRHLGVVTTTTS